MARLLASLRHRSIHRTLSKSIALLISGPRFNTAASSRRPIARAGAGTGKRDRKVFCEGTAVSLEHLPRADAGSYETLSVVDGVPRVAGYKAVRGLPLVVLVSYGRILRFGGLVSPPANIWTARCIRRCRDIVWHMVARKTDRNSCGASPSILARKSRELELTNSRFDIALSNMPNGLCMWDKKQRLVISNNRYREMYGLDAEQVKPGVSLREILETHRANGESSAARHRRIHQGRRFPDCANPRACGRPYDLDAQAGHAGRRLDCNSRRHQRAKACRNVASHDARYDGSGADCRRSRRQSLPHECTCAGLARTAPRICR